MQKGIKRLTKKNQSRLRGAMINLCRAVPHCKKIKCPYAPYTSKSLEILSFMAVDLDIGLPELPDNITHNVRKYRCTKMLLDYYGRRKMLKQVTLQAV